MFHNLKAQGLSVSQIARRSGCDRKTVRKYLSTEPDDLLVCQGVYYYATGRSSGFSEGAGKQSPHQIRQRTLPDHDKGG